MATHLSERQTQFDYFDQILNRPVWQGRKILDFGGNVGGFLVSAGARVDHDDYWCLDVTRAAIEEGSRRFPRAHFVHYDRYSSYFNPDGITNLRIPNLGLPFDIVLAFSVFTHTHQNEMLNLVEQLRSMLGTQGVLAFTFFDPCYDRSLSDPSLPPGTGVLKEFRPRNQNYAGEIEDVAETEQLPKWCAVVDDRVYLEPGIELCREEQRGKRDESYCSYFTSDYMASLFPDASVFLPVSPEYQHCCVLGSFD